MDNKSLVNSLNSLFPDLNFTVEKLKNINQTIMLDLCKKIIIYLYDTDSKNVVWKITEEQRCRSTHSELLMEATDILNIFKIMNKILKVISSEEFHLVDIIKPEVKRTVYFLKAIVHFRLSTSHYIEEQFVPCFHKLFKLQQEMDLLKNKLESLSNNLESKLSTVNNLKEEIAKLTEDGSEDTIILSDLQNKCRCLENEISDLEDTKHKLDKKIIESKNAIEQLNAEKKLLSDQIYEDYPEIKGKYQQFLLKKKECEAKISTEKITHATMQEKNEIITRLGDDFGELLGFVSKLEDVFSSNKAKKVEESKLDDLKHTYSKTSAHLTHRIEKCESERKALNKELQYLTEEENAKRLQEEEYLEKCNKMMDLLIKKELEYKENVKHYEKVYLCNVTENEELKVLTSRILANIAKSRKKA
ncbi:tropomyosin-2-like [Chrysoperla carnea]|uniref:tropomyosin-2-like n=1 Tax=Chrysoperla carnea TaxID=189513 RepID=UPI001D071F58|nr:tropomyosin-2-like [Chrysoperla carnea]